MGSCLGPKPIVITLAGEGIQWIKHPDRGTDIRDEERDLELGNYPSERHGVWAVGTRKSGEML